MDEINSTYEILRLIKRVTETFKKTFGKQFAELKLTGPQGMLIGVLVHFGDMKVSDLSEKMGLSNSTVSGILDRLENNRFIQRTRNEEDRRVVMVRLSPEYKEKMECHFKSLDELLTTIISNGNPEEVNRILLGFQTLDELINRSNDYIIKQTEPKV